MLLDSIVSVGLIGWKKGTRTRTPPAWRRGAVAHQTPDWMKRQCSKIFRDVAEELGTRYQVGRKVLPAVLKERHRWPLKKV